MIDPTATPDALAALAEEASRVEPDQIVGHVFQRLRPYGAAGIMAIAPLLADDARRPAIGVMIREIAQAGTDEREAACEALINAFPDVRPAGQEFLLRTIQALGCQVPDNKFPAETMFTPVADAVTARHAVAAYMPISKTDFGSFFLTECHWAFSEGWVNRHGGLSKTHDGRYCYFCARVLAAEE